MNLSQIMTLVIFVIVFAAIMWGRVHRYVPSLIGGALILIVVFLAIMKSPATVLNILNLRQLTELSFWLPRSKHIESHGVNWQTIIFIGGMMVMVEGLARVGFFRWMCLLVARLVKYKVVPILVSLCCFPHSYPCSSIALP